MVLTFMANPRVAIIVRRNRRDAEDGQGAAGPHMAIIVRRPGKVDGESHDIVVRFCQSLRIVEERDTDGTVVRVVRTILQEGRDKPVGGTELAEASGLKRVTVLHHLRRLEDLGLVERHAHRYMLRPSSLEVLMEGMRRDTLAMLAEAEEMAKEIDSEFRLGERKAMTMKKSR